MTSTHASIFERRRYGCVNRMRARPRIASYLVRLWPAACVASSSSSKAVGHVGTIIVSIICGASEKLSHIPGTRKCTQPTHACESAWRTFQVVLLVLVLHIEQHGVTCQLVAIIVAMVPEAGLTLLCILCLHGPLLLAVSTAAAISCGVRLSRNGTSLVADSIVVTSAVSSERLWRAVAWSEDSLGHAFAAFQERALLITRSCIAATACATPCARK